MQERILKFTCRAKYMIILGIVNNYWDWGFVILVGKRS